MSAARFYMSRSNQTVWGVFMRPPDEEHEDYWLPEFITAAWPPDTELAPDRPTDETKDWRLVFPVDADPYWEEFTPTFPFVEETES